MRIRWCERHKTVVHPRNDECCWVALAETRRNSTGRPPKCSFVEMQLVPADALVIEKVEGEWPKRVLEILRYDVATLAEAEPAQILDALAEAQR